MHSEGKRRKVDLEVVRQKQEAHQMMPARIVIILAVLVMAGCSDGGDRSIAADSNRSSTTHRAENGILITKAEYGNDWPYTVDSGLLYCDPPGGNVVLKSGGKVYALNGRAMGNAKGKGYLNARDSITFRDKNGYFTVGDVGKIISRGLSMCN
jgi:hypothetical protein